MERKRWLHGSFTRLKCIQQCQTSAPDRNIKESRICQRTYGSYYGELWRGVMVSEDCRRWTAKVKTNNLIISVPLNVL
ncbi:hypothetical protein CEXT_350191 [Caerostris extrusa]|uniref:Uncharacterized protein n=1 Tax=Caerostris extrusa TaxID=172846 RepID=A0AAV4X118_CAEEX|nr:hypothetical protein CEXT_350191 [Caerostris extrusa]